MTVRMPGEECLTKTQEAQREFRKKFVMKNEDPLALKGTAEPGGNTPVSAPLSNEAVKPSTPTDVSLTVNKKASSSGGLLNVTA